MVSEMIDIILNCTTESIHPHDSIYSRSSGIPANIGDFFSCTYDFEQPSFSKCSIYDLIVLKQVIHVMYFVINGE